MELTAARMHDIGLLSIGFSYVFLTISIFLNKWINSVAMDILHFFLYLIAGFGWFILFIFLKESPIRAFIGAVFFLVLSFLILEDLYRRRIRGKMKL